MQLKYLKGIGPKRAELFSKLGISTVQDLLFTYPRDYEDRTKIFKIEETDAEQICSVVATIITPIKEQRVRTGLLIYKFVIEDDENATMTITLFNQKYTAERLKEGEKYLFYGRVNVNFFGKEMTSPSIEKADDTETLNGKILPVYNLTAGISQKLFRLAAENALKLIPEHIEEFLPQDLRKKHNIAHIRFALEYIHKPNDFFQLETARRRFVFEELLILQIGLFELKKRNRGATGVILNKKTDLNEVYNKLPFILTNAQKRAIKEGFSDMQGTVPMNRLLQGDVGCGKTVVAAILGYFAIKNGCQVCIMAPTEILANQHFNSIKALMSEFDIECGLLIGGLPEKEKKIVIEKIKTGEIKFVIGTHSLIEDRVEFSNLALVITDEQHRFGVRQRAMLTQKGNNPHTLVMSATPIPRTLALIVYGDLDISVIDELPPGRKKINTFLIDDNKRDDLYNFVEKEMKKGSQAYIVCPLIEENDKLELKAVEEFSKEIKEKYFNDINIAFLHGRLKSKEKERIMNEFSQNLISILVSTTVIEVGVDVPNATIMVVENAERFGLSQLHQLRGRVGRSDIKSYCFLVSNSKSPLTKERLTVMTETNDGFKISEKDLELRGPGNFFGERQHGLPPLKIANMVTDIKVLNEAQIAAREIISEDELLNNKENEGIKNKIKELFSEYGLIIFN